MDLDQFQRLAQLKFKDVDLLQQAMTHRSYVNEHEGENVVHNERLEFLGDAILGFVVGEMLFKRFPDVPEGELTSLRAALVSGKALATLAAQIKVGDLLRMARGEETNGGRQKTRNLAGAFESLIGAIYLDQGLETARAFMIRLSEPVLEKVMAEQSDKDARSLLQVWSQARFNVTPSYRMVSETGPDHAKQFTVEVLVGDDVVGRGVGNSKQVASRSAAGDALRRIAQQEPQS